MRQWPSGGSSARRSLCRQRIAPWDLTDVDLFEVLVDVDGVQRKAWLFLLRLMYSGRDFAWIYEWQD